MLHFRIKHPVRHPRQLLLYLPQHQRPVQATSSRAAAFPRGLRNLTDCVQQMKQTQEVQATGPPSFPRNSPRAQKSRRERT